MKASMLKKFSISTAAALLMHISLATADHEPTSADEPNPVTVSVKPQINDQEEFTIELSEMSSGNLLVNMPIVRKAYTGTVTFGPGPGRDIQEISAGGGPSDADDVVCICITTPLTEDGEVDWQAYQEKLINGDGGDDEVTFNSGETVSCEGVTAVDCTALYFNAPSD